MHLNIVLSATVALVLQPISAVGHMLLAQPPHMGQINNGPVDGPNASGGGPYPCKYNGDPSFYSNAVRTTIPLGSNYTVKFTGSAVHGGGSCQFSLSKDLAPTVSSVFKVIYSIQGGCPARNTPGNLGSDASMPDPFEYPFTMPADLEPGQYTFAWTWINKVGNREFYMNCAAVDVTGTAENQGILGYYDTLPDMAVVNVLGIPCASEPDDGTGSYKYQNPGQFVETNDVLQTVEQQCFAPIAGRNAADTPAQSIVSGLPAVTPSNPSTETYEPSATNAVSIVTADRPASTVGAPGVFVSKSNVLSVPTGFATVVTGTSSMPSAVTAVTEVPPVSSNVNCPPTWQSCTATGFFCINETHFGICSFGCMPMAQELAEGVGCHMDTNTLYNLRDAK